MLYSAVPSHSSGHVHQAAPFAPVVFIPPGGPGNGADHQGFWPLAGPAFAVDAAIDEGTASHSKAAPPFTRSIPITPHLGAKRLKAVWCQPDGPTTGALLISVVATSSLFGAAKTAASGVASANSGAASPASQNVDPLAMALDNVMRASGQEPPTAQERDEASRIFVSALANGKFERGDRDYLASRLAARSGISEQDAQKRIDDAYARLSQTKETAKLTAERARKIAVLTAFLTAASLLVGAAAAAWAATLGGEHRDQNLRIEPAA